ncbi:type I-F CRISPR-associated protein Csy2 [Vibrio sp. FNV 38]|nr:type I-F CRISPR-associated protein Csy2 [Vibrio sp. FNV 38]
MTKLSDLLAIEDATEKQAILKKWFMPYTADIEVDGLEETALTVLLNLSSHHKGDKCKDWLDKDRAKMHLSHLENIERSIDELKWFHTHNLKFPDCRVREQRLIATTLATEEVFISGRSLEQSFGWAHNSSYYRHVLWLLNPFRWQSKSTNLFTLVREGHPVWLELLQDFGMGVETLALLQQAINAELPDSIFPSVVSPYSKQLRFPWESDYVSITPVVNHSIQRELEVRSRNKESKLSFVTSSLPNSASIGSLCGSVGGNMKTMSYPLGVKPTLKGTLAANRNKTGRYFDDYQVTNHQVCQVLSRLTGSEPLKTKKQRDRTRNVQSKILRKQIALWILPLIELRDRVDLNPSEQFSNSEDSLASAFLTLPESELKSLATQFNHRLNYVLQENKFTHKFAYHPKLLQVIKSQIVWVLNQLSKSSTSDEATQSEQYIYLTSMRVQDAVAMSSPYLSGAPSLTALWGFMHRYQREFNQLIGSDLSFEFSSFSFFVRSEDIQSTAKLTEPNSVETKRTVSNAKRPTIRSERLADLEIDMVIRVKSHERLSDYFSELKASLPMAFAGGYLFQPPISSEVNWLNIFSSQSEVFHAIKGAPTFGRWLYPSELQPSNFDELELQISSDTEILPVSLGYHLLEKPTFRENAITECHAYAENAIGVAKRVNPIEVRFSGRGHYFEHAFWSLECSRATILMKNYRN